MSIIVIAGATFAFIFGLIFATYWALVLRPEGRAGAQVRKRLKGQSRKDKIRASLLKEAHKRSEALLLSKILAPIERVFRPIEQTIEQSGVNLTLVSFLLMSAVSAGLALLLVEIFAHRIVLAVAAGVLASAGPYIYVRRMKTVRLRKFEEMFPEAIDLIARALRAGHAFTTGLGMAADEIPAPVGTEFRILHDRQNFGQPLPDALKGFADRVPLIDARFFVTTILTQRESGGNLSEVLDNLAGVIRERFKVKRQIRAVTAHARITGSVLILMPPFMGLALYTAGPENFSPLFKDPLGQQMLIGAACLQLLGTWIMRKLINFEY